MSTYLPEHPWTWSYQSKVGPIPWLEPSTEQMLSTLAKNGERNVLVVPISFVSEHIETLCEIDIEYKEVAHQAGIEQFHRCSTLLTHPDYIGVLADTVTNRLAYMGLLNTLSHQDNTLTAVTASKRADHVEPSLI
jgi:ferrochelatase